jgi:O-antigen/teichoic acid export membrane protein
LLGVENRLIWQRLRRNVSISTAGLMVSAVIMLLRTALLAKTLPIDDYGRVMLIVNLFLFLELFLNLGTHNLLYRLYSQFDKDQDRLVQKGLVILIILLNTLVGFTLSAGSFIAAPFLARIVFRSTEIETALRIYALSAFFFPYREFLGGILQLHDRFAALVVPQVIGNLVTLGLLAWHLLGAESPQIELVTLAFAAGSLTQILPSLFLAMSTMRHLDLTHGALAGIRALRPYRPIIARTLFTTNLTAYLHTLLSAGDVPLLGVIAGPTQVALFSLAKQLTLPLVRLSGIIESSTTPEVIRLWASGEFDRLRRVVNLYLAVIFGAGLVGAVALLFLGRPLVLWISHPQYLQSLPMVYLLYIALWITSMVIALKPIGVSTDSLHRLFIAEMISILLVLLVAFVWRLDAAIMAALSVLRMFISLLLFYIPIWRRLLIAASQQALQIPVTASEPGITP